MNKFSKYLLVNLGCSFGLGFILNLQNLLKGNLDEAINNFGKTQSLLSIPIFIAGLVVTIASEDKIFGTSLLATSGIVLVIGFSTCSHF